MKTRFLNILLCAGICLSTVSAGYAQDEGDDDVDQAKTTLVQAQLAAPAHLAIINYEAYTVVATAECVSLTPVASDRATTVTAAGLIPVQPANSLLFNSCGVSCSEGYKRLHAPPNIS